MLLLSSSVEPSALPSSKSPILLTCDASLLDAVLSCGTVLRRSCLELPLPPFPGLLGHACIGSSMAWRITLSNKAFTPLRLVAPSATSFHTCLFSIRPYSVLPPIPCTNSVISPSISLSLSTVAAFDFHSSDQSVSGSGCITQYGAPNSPLISIASTSLPTRSRQVDLSLLHSSAKETIPACSFCCPFPGIPSCSTLSSTITYFDDSCVTFACRASASYFRFYSGPPWPLLSVSIPPSPSPIVSPHHCPLSFPPFPAKEWYMHQYA